MISEVSFESYTLAKIRQEKPTCLSPYLLSTIWKTLLMEEYIVILTFYNFRICFCIKLQSFFYFWGNSNPICLACFSSLTSKKSAGVSILANTSRTRISSKSDTLRALFMPSSNRSKSLIFPSHLRRFLICAIFFKSRIGSTKFIDSICEWI